MPVWLLQTESLSSSLPFVKYELYLVFWYNHVHMQLHVLFENETGTEPITSNLSTSMPYACDNNYQYHIISKQYMVAIYINFGVPCWVFAINISQPLPQDYCEETC